MRRTPARCLASSVRTTWVCSGDQKARRARLSASTMSPTSTMRSASTACRNSFSSRTRACLNPRWISERNSVRALIVPRVGGPLAMAVCPRGFPTDPRSVAGPCVCTVTVWINISYELVSCASNLSHYSARVVRGRDHALGREMAREGAAGAEGALYVERATMALQHVLDDRKSETRAAGSARASRIDAIEALGEAWNVLARDAHARVTHGEVPALLVDPPAHLHRPFSGGVLGGVVDEVGERRMDLGLIAPQLRRGVDAHAHLVRMHRPRQYILAQQREQRDDVDGFPALDLIGLLQPRQREQVTDDGRHALGLAPHLRQRSLQIGIEHRVLSESLEVAGNHRQWRAQLVRGVGDEVATHGL